MLEEGGDWGGGGVGGESFGRGVGGLEIVVIYVDYQ